jgi:NAD(P)H-hydrate epimerase
MKQKGVTSQQMAEIDRRAQEEYGISQDVLMENAGLSVFETILSDTDFITDEKILIICGRGNNGGDGFVVARHLSEKSPPRLTVYASNPEKIKQGAASRNFQSIRDIGVEIRPAEDLISGENILKEYTISIDALFGTGFKGELPEEYSRLGEMLNSSGLKRYAVDIPSGLDSQTGQVAKNCFKADKTITFGLPKKGFFLADGPKVCGEIIVKKIGFPETLLKEYT